MTTRRLPSSPSPPYSLDTPLAVSFPRSSSHDSGASSATSSSTELRDSSSHFTRLGSTLHSSSSSSSARSADPALTDRELQSSFLGMDRSMWSATLNLTNVITGSGIIGLPYATRQCGLLVAVLLLLLLSASTLYSLHLLVSSAHRIRQRKRHTVDVEDVLGQCFGPLGYTAGLFAVFALDIGVAVALLIVVGDTVPPVLSYYTQGTSLWPLTGRTPVLIFVSVCFILPPSSLRSLDSLAAISATSIASVVCLTLVVVVRAFSGGEHVAHRATGEVEWVGPHPLQGFGAMAFVFVCHDVALQLYGGLRVKSVEAWRRVSRVSVAIASVPVLLLSVVGYVSFVDRTASNILNSYAMADHAVNAARLLLATSMALTYPSNLFMCRHVATQLLQPAEGKQTRIGSVQLHAALTAALFAFTLCVALLLDDLGPLQSLVGSLCAVSLAFIIPAAAAIRLAQRMEQRPLLSWSNAGPWALAVFGASIIGLSLITQLSDLLLPPSRFTLPTEVFVP